MAHIPLTDPVTLEDAAKLLRDWQLNEWALDRRMTKKAKREQRYIVREITERMCHRSITNEELDHVLGGMN